MFWRFASKAVSFKQDKYESIELSHSNVDLKLFYTAPNEIDINIYLTYSFDRSNYYDCVKGANDVSDPINKQYYLADCNYNYPFVFNPINFIEFRGVSPINYQYLLPDGTNGISRGTFIFNKPN